MKPLCFVLDNTAAMSTPTAILAGKWRCQRLHKPQRFQRLYLDSLDWRLLRKNLYLIADRLGNDFHLHLVDLRDNQTLAATMIKQLPDFSRSLPPGKISAVLTPILQQRALVSQIRLSVARHPMIVLNDDNDETVAHLDLEVSQPLAAGVDESIHVYRRLWFTPIEGYARQNKAIVNTLSEYGLPMLSAVIPVSYLISTLNIDSAKFDTKPTIEFHAAERADRAVKQLFRFLLAVMEANRQPVISDIDTECLHDFRVAVRHTRSLLGQARGVIDKGRRERAKTFFAWLNKVTSPQRDFDVMLLNFDFYRSLLPTQARDHLDPVYGYVMERRCAAAEITAHAVQSANYQRFIHSWQKYLEAEVAKRTTLKNAMKPVKALADARIWKAYKRVINDGGDIDDDSPAESLHSLRKKCKTLRHLIEFFASLYPAKKVKRILGLLKRLQDHLGKFQDLHVHIDLIGGTRSGLTERKLLSQPIDSAITEVIRALSEQQADCRRHFQERFEEFSAERHQHLYKQLFKP